MIIKETKIAFSKCLHALYSFKKYYNVWWGDSAWKQLSKAFKSLMHSSYKNEMDSIVPEEQI